MSDKRSSSGSEFSATPTSAVPNTHSAPRKSNSVGSLEDQMEKEASVEKKQAKTSSDITNSGNTSDQEMQDNDYDYDIDDNDDDDDNDNTPKVTLIAKFAKDRIMLENLPAYTTIGQVKQLLRSRTNILEKRQKLVGLVAQNGGAKGVNDDLPLSELKIKTTSSTAAAAAGSQKNQHNLLATHQFILMGTPEKDIFIDPSERDDLPDVVDDFELDFNAGSDEWFNHVSNNENLRQFTEKTAVHIMNPPRAGKPLLVLDLDHTLLDFSSKQLLNGAAGAAAALAAPPNTDHIVAAMKRPYMNEFLSTCYQYYDLVVWSQTSWRWLETKLIELGMLTHPGYKFSFVLDKTSMFTVVSTKRNQPSVSITHHVKPLQIIWSKFPDFWGAHNTVHVDDLSRNFALNLSSGLKIKPYHRKKSSARKDVELLLLSQYLTTLATTVPRIRFNHVDFSKWTDVVSGKRPLVDESSAADEEDDPPDSNVDSKPSGR